MIMTSGRNNFIRKSLKNGVLVPVDGPPVNKSLNATNRTLNKQNFARVSYFKD